MYAINIFIKSFIFVVEKTKFISIELRSYYNKKAPVNFYRT